MNRRAFFKVAGATAAAVCLNPSKLLAAAERIPTTGSVPAFRPIGKSVSRFFGPTEQVPALTIEQFRFITTDEMTKQFAERVALVNELIILDKMPKGKMEYVMY